MDEYYVYTDKGWWGKSSTFTSDLAQAAIFSRSAAVYFCRARVGWNLGLDLAAVPVAKKDVDDVLEK